MLVNANRLKSGLSKSHRRQGSSEMRVLSREAKHQVRMEQVCRLCHRALEKHKIVVKPTGYGFWKAAMIFSQISGKEYRTTVV